MKIKFWIASTLFLVAVFLLSGTTQTAKALTAQDSLSCQSLLNNIINFINLNGVVSRGDSRYIANSSYDINNDGTISSSDTRKQTEECNRITTQVNAVSSGSCGNLQNEIRAFLDTNGSVSKADPRYNINFDINNDNYISEFDYRGVCSQPDNSNISAPTTSQLAPIVPIPSPCYNFAKNFGTGVKGEMVLALQKILKQELKIEKFIYKRGKTELFDQDGVFGHGTRDAVKKFQQIKGLPETGFLGPQTRAILNARCKTTELPAQVKDAPVNAPTALDNLLMAIERQIAAIAEAIKALSDSASKKR